MATNTEQTDTDADAEQTDAFNRYDAMELVFLLPCIIWSGFVFSNLWMWFVVPLGVIEIGTMHSAGFMLICRWLTRRGVLTNQSTTLEHVMKRLGFATAAPLSAWALGAILHAFM